MRASGDGFTCVECGGNMDEVEDVPVLQSLCGHVVHRCGDYGHILLVPEQVGEWSPRVCGVDLVSTRTKHCPAYAADPPVHAARNCRCFGILSLGRARGRAERFFVFRLA